jgi:NAD(P)-dependent dehydrogenase (short-subunit alcohol dehydrogenase family)
MGTHVKTVVMTGGTTGLGKVAAQRFAAAPETLLVVGSRTAGPGTLPLDLTRLASVREFAEAVGAPGIDVLVLNAGTQQPNAATTTEDGFETTFAVNHLAHYLLLRLLRPRLASNATVVITTSDTHDPKTNAFGAPRDLDPGALARPRPGGFTAGFRAYAASKLCSILTARALAAADPDLRVIAYNPGFTPGTGLQREWPLWGRAAAAAGRVLRPIARLATVDQAGDALADLAMGRVTPPEGRVYASLVKRSITWPDPSDLARRDDLVHTLWDESARMAGLAP